jgi:hypothetical protein
MSETWWRAYGESGPDYDGQGRVICPPEEAYGPLRRSKMAAVADCRYMQGHTNVGVEPVPAPSVDENTEGR